MTSRARFAMLAIAGTAVVLLVALLGFRAQSTTPVWTDEELEILRSLSLESLEPLPADPSNRHADDPRAAALGEKLFFDTRLSSNGEVSCGSCHLPGKHFQDGTPLARGVGTTNRRTMPLAGTART